MRQQASTFGNVFFAAAAFATVWLGVETRPCEASTILESTTGYQATDYLSTINPKGFDLFDDMVAVYADGQLKVYDRDTWLPTYDLGDAGYGGTSPTYNSFVKFDPSGQSLWVGYTMGMNANDHIYQVTNLDTTPTWNYVTTVPANYDIAFSGTTPYLSTPNSGILGADNIIWRMDPSTGALTQIAAVGGFASGIDFDVAGNLYYATNFGWDNKLVMYTAEQVSEGNKTFAEATVLSTLPFDGADVEVDSAGHVLFAINHSEIIGGGYYQLGSTLGMWNGTSGNAENYSVIGTAGDDHWYTCVRTLGDVTDDGLAYLSDGGAWLQPVPGLAEIHHLMSGDANGDDSVNGTDLNTVLSNYNLSGMDWSQGDFNGDGSVNGTDLNAVLSNYNQTANATASVPEPSTLVLMIACGLALWFWRCMG